MIEAGWPESRGWVTDGPVPVSIPRSLHLFGSQILWASRKRYLGMHLSDPTSDGEEGAKGYGRMKALAAQLCEGKALLCWMVAEKQYLARGLATNEPYLCLLLSFPGPFWLACVAHTLDGGGAGVGG